MILDPSRIMLSAVGCYVVREVTLSRSWGPVLFVFPFYWGGRGLYDIGGCCACSRHFCRGDVLPDRGAGKKYIGTRKGIRIDIAKSGNELTKQCVCSASRDVCSAAGLLVESVWSPQQR